MPPKWYRPDVKEPPRKTALLWRELLRDMIEVSEREWHPICRFRELYVDHNSERYLQFLQMADYDLVQCWLRDDIGDRSSFVPTQRGVLLAGYSDKVAGQLIRGWELKHPPLLLPFDRRMKRKRRTKHYE